MNEPPYLAELLGLIAAYALFTIARTAVVARDRRYRETSAASPGEITLPVTVYNALYLLEILFVTAIAFTVSVYVRARVPGLPAPAAWLVCAAGLILIRSIARALLPYRAAAFLGYFVTPVVKLVYLIAWPWFWCARVLSVGINRFTRARVVAGAIAPAVEVLQAERVGAPLAEDERDMIDAIIDFRETLAREVMVPRVEMVTADIADSLDEIKRLVVDKGVSRVPVVQDTPDNVVGILHAKDIFKLEKTGAGVKTVLRQPLFVPETKKVNQLLREMRAAKTQLAIVVDEYGGTAGLVTLEDVLEEIVGEIHDEYDAEVKLLDRVGEGQWLVAGRMDIGELNEQLGLHIPEEDFETLGGFISFLFGKVPAAGETTPWEDCVFEVIAADARRVQQVRITKRATGNAGEDD